MILSLACDTILILSQEALFCYPHHFRLLYSPQHSWGIRLFIHKGLSSQSEKACVLAEELGHYHTTYGNILDESDISNRKQELRARAWGYDKQIGLFGLIKAYEHGCKNQYEISEYLDVTEKYLNECLVYYQSKYGMCKSIDNYVIYFIPNLIVFKKL